MKPFLGIDITEDKMNEECNGAEFVVQRASAAMSDALERASDEVFDVVENKAKLPKAVRAVGAVCGAVGVIGAGAVMDSEDISATYHKAPWLFWMTGVCLVIWVIYKFAENSKKNKVLESDESKNIMAKADAVSSGIYTELGVPLDAPEVDLLSMRYKIKNNKIAIKKNHEFYADFTNFAYRIFIRDGMLCFADCEEKYAFPLSELRCIETVKKKSTVSFWHKTADIKDEIYKPYRMKELNDYGALTKYYHILELDHNGEIWGIYFPCYELPVFESLTGIKA